MVRGPFPIYDMPQILDAAKEQLKPTQRRFFRNNENRRKLLRSFVAFSGTVLEFYPRSDNSIHPQLPMIDEACVGVMTDSSGGSKKQKKLAISS